MVHEYLYCFFVVCVDKIALYLFYAPLFRNVMVAAWLLFHNLHCRLSCQCA